jgi:membrane-bound metal-dependent hydrolase YbcI (DUF457 family)
MKWYTHAAIGANAVWLVALDQSVTSGVLLYAALGAFASLLPDIDAGWSRTSGAKIHYVAHGIFKPFMGAFRHRGFFHSFLCVTLLFCAAIPLAFLIDPYFPLVLTAGYASHLVIDSWNGGMQTFFPWKKDVTFVPKLFRFRVGSLGDDLFFLLGIAGLVVFIFSYWHVFLFHQAGVSGLFVNPLGN